MAKNVAVGAWQGGRKTHWGLKNQWREVSAAEIEMQLAGGHTTFIDKASLAQVIEHTWRAISRGGRTYAGTNIPKPGGERGKQTSLSMHQLLCPGRPKIVDHIDRNGLNNKLSNLRDGSNGVNENNCKLRSDNTSGENGIGITRDYWCVQWFVDHKRHSKHFRFNTETKEARLKAATEFRDKIYAKIGNFNGMRR